MSLLKNKENKNNKVVVAVGMMLVGISMIFSTFAPAFASEVVDAEGKIVIHETYVACADEDESAVVQGDIVIEETYVAQN